VLLQIKEHSIEPVSITKIQQIARLVFINEARNLVTGAGLFLLVLPEIFWVKIRSTVVIGVR